MVMLICEQLKVFTSTTRLPVPTCHIMRSFVCEHFNPNWLQVVFQFRDGHMWNILVNKQHHTAAMMVSVFPVYIVWARFREQFWMKLSIFVSWIATMWVWWKSRKANNSSFFPLMLLMFMLTNFSRYCAKWKRPSFLFFCREIKSILIF